jgi:hypothetical protein
MENIKELPDTAKQAFFDFDKNYKLINSSILYNPIKEKSIVCRYCGKTNSETTFKQITHLLPELLGQNDIQTYDECDLCNNLFSGYESNLSIYIRPYITLLGIEGKGKTPDFQSRSIERNEETRTTLIHDEGNKKQLFIQNLDDYKINSDEKSVEINFRKPPFKPISVYKALLKIGLSLLPKEFDTFNKKSFEWLAKKNVELAFCKYAFQTSLQRSRFPEPCAYLYRAKQLFTINEEFPEHILILCFANQIIQIFLPFSDELWNIHKNERNLNLNNIFPAFVYEKSPNVRSIGMNIIDLGDSHTVKQDHKISFSFESIEFHSPPKNVEL